jgi:hypothetical protein
MAIVSDPMAHLQADPVEDAHRRGGVQAVAQVMDRHMVSVMRVRSGFCLNDTDLLTSDIVSTGVPREESDEVVRLHGDVRDIIDRIAVQIEEGKYRDAEEAIRSMPLAHNERERASSIVAADRKLHISYQSLRVAVELFGQLNQIILDRVRRERSPDDEANLMLGNAILVYELADFVMRFIEDFAVAGGPEIASLHDETRARIAAARKAEAELGTKVAAEGIDPTIRAQTLENITQREEALDELEKEWDMYVTDVSRLHGAVDEVRGKVATLSIIRENARLQINVIQLTSLLNFLKQNSDAMDGTIEALKNLRLAPLSSNRVRRLLGLR